LSGFSSKPGKSDNVICLLLISTTVLILSRVVFGSDPIIEFSYLLEY